jgi:hypothetical protein
MHEGPQYEEERATPDMSTGEGEEFTNELGNEGEDALREACAIAEEGLPEIPTEVQVESLDDLRTHLKQEGVSAGHIEKLIEEGSL